MHAEKITIFLHEYDTGNFCLSLNNHLRWHEVHERGWNNKYIEKASGTRVRSKRSYGHNHDLMFFLFYFFGN